MSTGNILHINKKTRDIQIITTRVNLFTKLEKDGKGTKVQATESISALLFLLH